MLQIKKLSRIASHLGLLPLISFMPIAHASFIESTIGTAVVNDATAARYNPAALVVLKNPQIIPVGTLTFFRTRFNGTSTAIASGLSETGSSPSHSRFESPSLYAGLPLTNRMTVGIAILANDANRSAEDNSILRYVQSGNTVQDYDVIPAVGYKINDQFSLGAGVAFSYADFHLRPVIGFPGSDVADTDGYNHAQGSGVGLDAGFLLRPSRATVLGMNYRSITTYHLSGSSELSGAATISSSDYHYKMWTPARTTFSINHFFTKTVGLVTTVQYIQWSAITNVHSYNVATVIAGTPVIVNGVTPQYLRDTYLLTLGGHYRFMPQCILRVVGTYNQSPGNPHYQIVNGNDIIFAASVGYDVNKTFTVDAGYAHAFVKDQNINIIGSKFIITGVNQGARDAFSVKLTINL